MTKYRIAKIPGDGIGPDVMAAAVKVLEVVEETRDIGFDFVELEVGDALKARTGVALPPGTIEEIEKSDAGLFAAVGETAKEVILPMRQELDLFVNLRPAKVYPNVPHLKEDVDIVMVRENTEGIYKMIGDRGDGWGFNVRVITTKASERIARWAFDYAVKYEREKVTCVHKSNVLDKSCGVFQEACQHVAGSYPNIEYDEVIVDACAMRLILRPEAFDVIVTTNLFGDILSDEAAGLVGGLGMTPSGNIGDNNAVFEPIHGTAPRLAGTGRANPMATILSAGMMLDWLGERNAATSIEDAVIEVLNEAKTLTPDLGGSAGTMDVAAAVSAKL
ncbi:MAG: isocitrate/isopropylmalate dehydrogenase family protein [Candidatus Bathyarchaeota archaeon]|nr:MAG: isocitrate/isopropylmalate dehydrogenase family protein [Candidatus Bathyarchaeota archaeon]